MYALSRGDICKLAFLIFTSVYKYFISLYNGTDSDNYVVTQYEFLTSDIICAYGELETSDNYIRTRYKMCFIDSSGNLSSIIPLKSYTYAYQKGCVNGVVTYKDLLNVQGHGNVFVTYSEYNGKTRSDTFITNIPIFSNSDSANEYLTNGDDSGAINKPPTINNSLYFKNIGYSVRAEDSSENADATYIIMNYLKLFIM